MGGGPVATRSPEAALALVLAVLAGLRVALFAAGFPFFSNVDEHRHIDAVLKYARGYWPAPETDAYEPQMPMLLGIYGSPEYHASDAPDASPVGPPPWKGSPARTVQMIERNERFLAARPNLEAFQPPVYYALAGAWLRVGRGLGLEGGRLLYWVRGLNAVAMFGLVLAVWSFLTRVAPSSAFVRLGVPALLVVFPQDALYYVTRDSLSPWMGAAGWFAAFAIARRPESGWGLHAGAGLVAALAFLSKYTNAVVWLLYGLAAGVALAGSRRREALPKLGLTAAIALLPVAIWLAHNQIVFGDWLATGVKLERLGWGRRSLFELWDHPVFSPAGAWIFLQELLTTFWRGELAWYRRTLALPWADAFYVASSLVLLGLAGVGTWRQQAGDERFASILALVAVVGAAGVLVVLSTLFVFGEHTNPTADNPYLSQGRLVAFALVPFAFLYVRGIEVAASVLAERLRVPAAWGLLAVVLAVVTTSEGALSAAVLASDYNAFHYP
jgi:hypothetical protein